MNLARILRLRLGGSLRTGHSSLESNVRVSCDAGKGEQSLLLNHGGSRFVSTIEGKALQNEESLIKRTLKKIPFLNVERTKIRASGYLLYEAIADRVNYIDFFEKLDLPDTFYSWFVVTEVHIWMVTVRAMAEGDNGRLLRNSMIEALWADVNQRVKHLGASNPAMTRAQISELSEQFQAALIAYDEGLQSDDTVLAGALWRRFYQQQDIDLDSLDMLVMYVRKHLRLLDHISSEQLLSNKNNIKWRPLQGK